MLYEIGLHRYFYVYTWNEWIIIHVNFFLPAAVVDSDDVIRGEDFEQVQIVIKIRTWEYFCQAYYYFEKDFYKGEIFAVVCVGQ